MFMYKEDVDLAYRLQWAGWKSYFWPNAIAYHDRSIEAVGARTWNILKNRSRKAKWVNRMSYLNHQILLEKNVAGQNFSSEVRGHTFWYNLKVFCYLLFFETELLTEWWKFFRMKKEITARKNAVIRRVSGLEIEKLMEG